MSPVMPARRRAEEFQQLLADPTAGGSDELVRLAELTRALADAPTPAPRAEFSAALRERLMEAAATELAPTTPEVADRLTVAGLGDAETRRRHQRRAGTVVATLAVVGGVTGTAMASQSALPGDPLYGVKQTIEGVSASLSSEDHGATMLERAGKRLAEVRALSERGSTDAGAYRSALGAFQEQARAGVDQLLDRYSSAGDERAVVTVRDFTAESLHSLTRAEPGVPAGAREQLVAAADLLLELDQRAADLCAACGGAGITELPGVLVSAATPLPTPEAPLTRATEPGPAPADEKPGIDLPQGVPGDVSATVPDPAPQQPAAPRPAPRPSGGAPAPSEDPSVLPGLPDGSGSGDDSGGLLSGEDGLLTGEKGLLPADKTGPVGELLDGTVGTLEGVVGGLLTGLGGSGSGTTSTD